MRSQNAAIYRWACKAVAIGHPFCSLTLILLLVIVSFFFACTMMEAQSLAESNAREVGGPAESSSTNSSTNRSAVQDEHWNMSAAQKDASSEAGIHQVNGDRQDGWIHSWLRAVDTVCWFANYVAYFCANYLAHQPGFELPPVRLAQLPDSRGPFQRRPPTGSQDR
jgi:hypothetical protein